uniref:Phd finger domain protein n=1 Tax=Melanopsichium pennsylvanicum 4 TaxID=1398559 RepID=A0A077RB06_9BASI|nr:phd finger domain protein [Melanopsichium pennsylvanicum 4]
MPARRSLGAVAGPSAPAAPPVVELHPTTRRLRKMWKFAAVCQFLFVFDEAFGMSGFETETLETDFENNETNVIPDLVKRLLYTLTLNRTIDLVNWQHHLRTQYDFRDEHSHCRFGTPEAPIEWAQLSLEDKIATLHDLCEWQLMDSERFRKLVKSEEDITTWRVSPIGWDAHDNAYWLFDDNRIWIQRPQPAPKPPTKPRAPPKKGSKRARMEAAAVRRAASAATKPSTAAKPAGAKRSRSSDVTPSPTPSKRTRSSLVDSAASTPSRPPHRRGMRTSARFAPQEEQETISTPTNGLASQTDAAGHLSDSELSEPPEILDEKVDAKRNKPDDDDNKMENADAEENDEADAEAEERQHKQEDGNESIEEDEWIEFEAIVVTRQEWLDFAKRFSKSKDPNEKNLHHFINNEILDQVLAAMEESERQRALEQALANRKRSSRIAMKESEREERERDREARARMEDKMAAIRKEDEQKRQREEEEHEAQRSRADRLREREERLRAREIEIETKALREEEERERREREREERKRRREEIIANGGVPPPSKESTPMPEDAYANGPVGAIEEEEEEWELNCEVCGKNAISPPDEDKEIVCCEHCGVWQHIKCWDSFDRQVVGLKKKRDWDTVDFLCSKCRPPAADAPVPYPGILSRSNKSSPRGKKRSSNGSESPACKGDAAASAAKSMESPRQRIKLVSESKNGEVARAWEAATQCTTTDSSNNGLAKPPTVPSQKLRPPTAGAQPAETGLLTSSSAATKLFSTASQVDQLPPPTSHAVPTATAETKPNLGRPLLPPATMGGNAIGDPSKPDLATTNQTTKGNSANGSTQSGSGLGMGRPSQTMQFSVMGSPRSSSSGGASSPNASGHGNGAGATSPRSPSYGVTFGGPAFRRPSQASGSFPMRHTPAKSPLSRPYESLPQKSDPINGFSLGPPRATSPSASRGIEGLVSLGAAANSLHPSSAATIPAAIAGPTQAHAVGHVVGGAFAPACSDAAVAGSVVAPSSPGAAPAPVTVTQASPTRPSPRLDQTAPTDGETKCVQLFLLLLATAHRAALEVEQVMQRSRLPQLPMRSSF